MADPSARGPSLPSPQGTKALTAWEKADILGKLVSGALLGLIALLIKMGADNITTAQKQGELVQSLLQDLTTKDQRTRQDLALIALDHAVGDKNPPLMIDIAERLVTDTTTYSAAGQGSDQVLGGIAFRILQRRSPALADSLRRHFQRQYEQQLAADTALRSLSRSPADTTKSHIHPSSSDSLVAPSGALLARVASNVVFIQYQGAVPRALADTLRRRLGTAGFVAPGTERVDAPFRSAVRYFHPADLELADSVASMTQDFLSARDINQTVPVQPITSKGVKVPSGQLEVWLSW
jgi:hypothetical protein